MLKKYKYFLITINIIGMGIVLHRNCIAEMKKSIPIVYNEQHIRKLEKIDAEDAYWKKHGFILKKVDELGDVLAEVYQFTEKNGVGWSEDTGDFVRIRLKLRSGHVVQFDELAGWMKILQESKLIPNSPNITRHPYGITLDMGQGDQILILIGASPSDFVTLIYIGNDIAEVIFHQADLYLSKVLETQKGYLLQGELADTGECMDCEDTGITTCYPRRGWELLIKNNQLSFQELPDFDQKRLRLPLSFDKKHIESLKKKKKPVDQDEGLLARKEMDATINMLSAKLRNYWYGEHLVKRLYAIPGDFCRIDFSLPSGVRVGMLNRKVGWVKPSSNIRPIAK